MPPLYTLFFAMPTCYCFYLSLIDDAAFAHAALSAAPLRCARVVCRYMLRGAICAIWRVMLIRYYAYGFLRWHQRHAATSPWLFIMRAYMPNKACRRRAALLSVRARREESLRYYFDIRRRAALLPCRMPRCFIASRCFTYATAAAMPAVDILPFAASVDAYAIVLMTPFRFCQRC